MRSCECNSSCFHRNYLVRFRHGSQVLPEQKAEQVSRRPTSTGPAAADMVTSMIIGRTSYTTSAVAAVTRTR